MRLTYGEMFAGYDGLGMGVRSVLGGRSLWHAENDAAPSKILAFHWPATPNLGDVTKVDWAAVAKVDVITGGSPCQDLSHAGSRAGMRAGTRSGLWSAMCDAIETIRPRLVVWENVRGALSADADSDMEPCAGCLGGPDDGPVLRALGRVLGDLAELRYDARWYGLRAADVGAPHGRFRIFVFASDALGGGRDGRSPEPVRGEVGRAATAGGGEVAGVAADADSGRLEVSAELDGDPAQDPADRDSCRGHADGHPRTDWGQYAPAIHRWEHVLGRAAPASTEAGPKGGQRLSPAFVEWLMGLPAGHVTDPAIGISRNDQLKALGNGVVPQQAAAATRMWLADVEAERAA